MVRPPNSKDPILVNLPFALLVALRATTLDQQGQAKYAQ